jgi:hypothetical protein
VPKGVHLSLMMGPVVPAPVARDVIDALASGQVTVSAGQRSGFQLTFALSKMSRLTRTLIPAGFFDPMVRVIIVVTLNGTPDVVMDGLITRQQVAPSNEPGQSTLTVTGEDVSQAMDLQDLSGVPYPGMPPEARVALIVARYAFLGLVPMVLPSVVVDAPVPVKEIPKHRGTDLQYVTQLAAEVGYVFYVDPGPAPGLNVAYWGPEIKVGPVQPALSVNMDAHTNVESLSFTYDGLSKTLYFLFIQEPTTKAPIPIPVPDVTPLNPPLGARLPIPWHVKFLTSEEKDGTAKHSAARAAAVALAAAAKSSDVISGTGTLDVLRYGRLLKARQLVAVRGAGLAYDGFYYVKSVTHSIKRGEYKQSFTLTRNALVPTTATVPV